MKKIIKKHSLILLNLYGVKEKLILENPEALNSFVELLGEEFDQEIEKEKQKLIKEIEKEVEKISNNPKITNVGEIFFELSRLKTFLFLLKTKN